MAGQGWRMLVEQLSVGRCISLPSNATGGAKAGRVRHRRVRAHPPPVQPCPSGKFRGRRGSARTRWPERTYIMDAARSVTTAAHRQRRAPGSARGDPQVPRAPSWAARSRTTRWTCTAARASCSGRRTISRAATRSCRSAITVEGANILTRSLIIFGQGAIRCHPFVLREMNAAKAQDEAKGLDEFDDALFGHIGLHAVERACARFVMAADARARSRRVPEIGRDPALLPAHQPVQRVSSRFATDVAMLHARRLSQEEGASVGAARRRALALHTSPSMVLKHYQRPGAARRPTCRWSNGPAARSCTAAQEQTARIPAQLPEPLGRGADARS